MSTPCPTCGKAAGPPRISHVVFSAAPERDVHTGLLGWASFTLGDLHLDGVAVRRTRDGRLTLSFPERRDARGGRHPIVRPLDDAARRAIEEAVFRALGLDSRDREEACT